MEGYWITEEALADFQYLIPDFYKKGLRDGSVFGIGIVEPMRINEIVAAVIIRERNGWTELVWLALDEVYRGFGYSFDVLRFCMDMFHSTNRSWGLFMNLPSDGAGEALKDKLTALGFTMHPVVHHCYSVTLEKIKQNELFQKHQKVKQEGLKMLSDLSDHEKKRITQVIQREDTILPLTDKIDFDRYEKNLSYVRYDGKGNPDGLLLVTQNGNHLTLDCVWGKTPLVLVQLICKAVLSCGERYEDEVEIVVPTVTEASQKLAERLMPNARPIQGLQARKLFS